MTVSGWKKTERGDMLILCNELSLLVFEADGSEDFWWYQIIASNYPEDAIISQFHAPSEIEAKQAALETASRLGKRTAETAEAGLRRLMCPDEVAP